MIITATNIVGSYSINQHADHGNKPCMFGENKLTDMVTNVVCHINKHLYSIFRQKKLFVTMDNLLVDWKPINNIGCPDNSIYLCILTKKVPKKSFS